MQSGWKRGTAKARTRRPKGGLGSRSSASRRVLEGFDAAGKPTTRKGPRRDITLQAMLTHTPAGLRLRHMEPAEAAKYHGAMEVPGIMQLPQIT